jgi:hypothetical protein
MPIWGAEKVIQVTDACGQSARTSPRGGAKSNEIEVVLPVADGAMLTNRFGESVRTNLCADQRDDLDAVHGRCRRRAHSRQPTVLEFTRLGAINYGGGLRVSLAPSPDMPDAYGFLEWSHREVDRDPRLNGERIFAGIVLRY